MATIKDMAFDYAMQKGNGKKAYEHFAAGAKAVIKQIQESWEIGGFESMVDCINCLIDEFK